MFPPHSIWGSFPDLSTGDQRQRNSLGKYPSNNNIMHEDMSRSLGLENTTCNDTDCVI